MTDRWQCHGCGETFETPSFSEGPKNYDERTQALIRFAEAELQCPFCFSPDLAGTANHDPLTLIPVQKEKTS